MNIDTNRYCWEIRRDGNVSAYAQSHRVAQNIIKVMKRAYPHCDYKAVFVGTPIAHCEIGGRQIGNP